MILFFNTCLNMYLYNEQYAISSGNALTFLNPELWHLNKSQKCPSATHTARYNLLVYVRTAVCVAKTIRLAIKVP